MLARLERLIGEIGITSTASRRSRWSAPVAAARPSCSNNWCQKLNVEPLNVGLELGRRLAAHAEQQSAASRQANCCVKLRTKERTEDPLLLDT